MLSNLIATVTGIAQWLDGEENDPDRWEDHFEILDEDMGQPRRLAVVSGDLTKELTKSSRVILLMPRPWPLRNGY